MLPELKTIDSMGFLNAFRAGEADGRERWDREATHRIGQAARTGGYLSGAKAAMEFGKIDLAAKLEQLSADKQMRFYDAMGRAASGADTPEKWTAMTRRMSEMYGPEAVKGFEHFGMRDSAIRLSMTALQQAELKLRQEESRRAAASSAREAALAPLRMEAMRLDIDKARAATPEGRAALFDKYAGPDAATDPRRAAFVAGIPDKPPTTIKIGKDDRLLELPTPSRPGGYRDVTPEPTGGAGFDKERFDSEHKLRTQFLNQADEYMKVRDAFGRIQASSEVASAASDISLIFNYMKMLDPGSVVRETEYATAQNAAGVPDRVRAVFNRILDGQRLAPAQRADFLATADRLYKEQTAGFGRLRGEIERVARASRLDPSRVLLDIERPGAAPPGTTRPPPAVTPPAAPPPRAAGPDSRTLFTTAPAGHRVTLPAEVTLPDGRRLPAGTVMEKGPDGSYYPSAGGTAAPPSNPWDRVRSLRD